MMEASLAWSDGGGVEREYRSWSVPKIWSGNLEQYGVTVEQWNLEIDSGNMVENSGAFLLNSKHASWRWAQVLGGFFP